MIIFIIFLVIPKFSSDCIFFLNHHVYYVENEHRGARVDAWQLDRMLVAVVQVRDDIGLN